MLASYFDFLVTLARRKSPPVAPRARQFRRGHFFVRTKAVSKHARRTAPAPELPGVEDALLWANAALERENAELRTRLAERERE